VPSPEAHELSREETIAWQAALEGKGFSPGLLDGRLGPKTLVATRAFQESRGLPVSGQLDEITAQALGVSQVDPVTSYTVASQDQKDVGYCPTDWIERSQQPRLLYPTLSSCLAEKFHTSERCLSFLNPEKDLASLKIGDTIRVPTLRQRSPLGAIEGIEIDLTRKLVLIFGGSFRLQGLLHCSVARDLSIVARGEFSVSTVVMDPNYTFDPAKWPEVKGVERKLFIPPGPRCPVGLRWIGLDVPGVGLHGTADPENIGKTGSHGCFRFTNWDAVYLAAMVSVGTKVRVVERSPMAEKIAGGD